MQKARGKATIYLISLPIIISCVLRFFQLLRYTDKKTGLIVDGGNLSFVIYALLLVIFIISALYSKRHQPVRTLFASENGTKGEFLSSVFLSGAFFADFMYQSFNCYSYSSRVSYIDYTFLIPLALSGLLALACCFYFLCASMTANGSNYDFRNFTILHFAPVLWGFFRLLLIMLKIIDVKLDVEATIEFLLIAMMIMFFFCYISMLDNGTAPTRAFVYFAVITFSLSLILALPRIALIIIGKGSQLSHIDYFPLTFVAVGVFAITLTQKSVKEG